MKKIRGDGALLRTLMSPKKGDYCIWIGMVSQVLVFLKMTTPQVVETSVTVNNSAVED